jgi:hypothetical protein
MKHAPSPFRPIKDRAAKYRQPRLSANAAVSGPALTPRHPQRSLPFLPAAPWRRWTHKRVIFLGPLDVAGRGLGEADDNLRLL